jgi:hypothetical protein
MADKMYVDINGFEQLVGIMRSMPTRLGGATTRATQAWCYRVLTTANSKYTPIKSGDLAASGRVEVLDANTSGTGRSEVAIKFTKDYALDQHENEQYKHPNGGEAHYLLKAVNEHKGELLSDAAREIRSSMRR